MRAGLLASTVLHASIIGFMAVSFASPSPYEVTPPESMPIDIISDAEMSKMMAGKKDAPKENPKPVVEKKADTAKQAENLDSKVSEKPEVKAASEPSAPPPPPQAKPADPKPPAAQAEAKPTPPPPKEAEALAAKPPEPPKDQPKPQEQAQAAPPPPPRKPKNIPPKVAQDQTAQRDFNPNQIAALLNKQDPRRMAAIGDTINNTASLGASRGSATSLSQTEIDALRAYISRFWKLPAGGVDVQNVTVVFKIMLTPDRRMIGTPQLVEVQGAANPYASIVQETAQRALFTISNEPNPFPMLRADRYDTWRELELGFNPSMLN